MSPCTFGRGKQREGLRGGFLAFLAHASGLDEGQNVGQSAVFVLMRKRDLGVPAAYVVHFLSRELHAAGKCGHDGGEMRLQFVRLCSRHAQKTGEKHVAGEAGMGAYGQHGRRGRVVFMMFVGMVMMFVAHRLFTTRAAAQAAP